MLPPPQMIMNEYDMMLLSMMMMIFDALFIMVDGDDIIGGV